MNKRLRTKLLELDPNKGYILVMRKGGVNEIPTMPKGAIYTKPIPIIWVESVDDVKLIEKKR